MATAQSLIRELIASGLNKSQIAKRLGRDSSLIGQIEKGKKPGNNLIEPLLALKNGQEIPEVERRRTKSGEVAKVRQSKAKSEDQPKIKVERTLIRDKRGRIKIAKPTKAEHVAVRRLKEIAEAGGKVSIQLVFANGSQSVLYQKGGEYASRLVYRFENSGQSFFEFLTEERFETISARYGQEAEIVDLSESPVAVGFIAIYTAAKDI